MAIAGGLRAKKKARIKMGILEIVIRMLKEKSFDEIYIEEICNRAEISKVTFFKYFSAKEEILAHFMRVWCFRRTVEQRKGVKSGLDGVYHLFGETTRFSADYPQARFMMISLLSYLAKQGRRPVSFELDPGEKQLLFPTEPDLWDYPVLTLDQLLYNYLTGAARAGEISGSTDLAALAQILVSIFYGLPVSGLIFNQTDMAGYYQMHLDFIFKKAKTERNPE